MKANNASIAVVGAGRMGCGIALVYALDGNSVTVTDQDQETLGSLDDRIGEVLDLFVAVDRITASEATSAQENIQTANDIQHAVSSVDFVTEAVVEDLSIKQSVFETIGEHAPAEAILATNTSSLPIDQITTQVDNKERVLATHWFNPPYLVPLVELVKGAETSDATIEWTKNLLESAGKTPIVVEKDIPGFIGNRIQAAMSYEAFSLLEQGVATPEDIDKAVKAGFGFRLPIMGIFEKMDHSGLHIHREVERSLMPDLDRGTDPNAVVETLLESGHRGTETGKGIYDWAEMDLTTVESDRDRSLLALLELYETLDTEQSPPANYDKTE